MEFESAQPSIVKSIKQRDLLNTWLRLYARNQSIPRLSEYKPDEIPDLVFYTVNTGMQPPRLTIESDGTRMSSAYGNTGKGRYLDEYLGARLAPIVMPIYYECIVRRLPRARAAARPKFPAARRSRSAKCEPAAIECTR